MLSEGAHLEGVSCGHHDVVPLAFQLTDDREEERHVRRVVEIDPDLLRVDCVVASWCPLRVSVAPSKRRGTTPATALPVRSAPRPTVTRLVAAVFQIADSLRLILYSPPRKPRMAAPTRCAVHSVMPGNIGSDRISAADAFCHRQDAHLVTPVRGSSSAGATGSG